MTCQQCGERFPAFVTIDGRKRNLQNRKYCFTCSPFGRHNTRRLEVVTVATPPRRCVTCTRPIHKQDRFGQTCWTCRNRANKATKIERIQALVGRACWVCGYDKTWHAMDLHHVDPATKEFAVTTRELQYSWDRIEREVRKCALLCCRCHRELHAGLIDAPVLRELWLRHWHTASL